MRDKLKQIIQDHRDGGSTDEECVDEIMKATSFKEKVLVKTFVVFGLLTLALLYIISLT